MRFSIIVAITCGSALTFAIVLVLMQHLTLDPSDLAYDEPAIEAFQDPFVVDVMILFAMISAIIFAPLYYVCLKDTRLLVSVPIVTGAVPVSYTHLTLPTTERV